jgi:GxxExxY protein
MSSSRSWRRNISHRDTENTEGTKPEKPKHHLDWLTEPIIGCAINVHRALGPGLLEATYENALCVELHAAGLKFERQVTYPVLYRGIKVGEYRVDLVVEDKVIVELKSVEALSPLFTAQVLAYLRVTGKEVGLMFNFNSTVLMKGGFRRLVL